MRASGRNPFVRSVSVRSDTSEEEEEKERESEVSTEEESRVTGRERERERNGECTAPANCRQGDGDTGKIELK